jgi:hypothetical protein
MPLHTLIMINPSQIDILAISIDYEVDLIIPENKTLLVDLIGARMEFLHGRSSATPKEHPVAEVLIQQRQSCILDRLPEIILVRLRPDV